MRGDKTVFFENCMTARSQGKAEGRRKQGEGNNISSKRTAGGQGEKGRGQGKRKNSPKKSNVINQTRTLRRRGGEG